MKLSDVIDGMFLHKPYEVNSVPLIIQQIFRKISQFLEKPNGKSFRNVSVKHTDNIYFLFE